MPRRKQRGDEWLPPGVGRGKSAYEYRPYIDGKRVTVKLCPLDSPRSDVLKRYEDIRAGKIEANDSLKWLCDQYLKSKAFAGKSPNTRRDYKLCYEQVVNAPLRNGAKFGSVKFAAVTPGAIRKYMDSRSAAPIRANREKAFISLVYSWACERDIAKSNPGKGVRRYKEESRKHYVSQASYDYIYKLAASGPWYIQPAMEIAYLCRMRSIEVFALRRADVLEQGLDTRRVKGSKDTITKWSPRLRAAIDSCKRRSTVQSLYLLSDSHGQPIQLSAFRTAWGRLMRLAEQNGFKDRFTFHDLKRAGVTDTKGDKLKASGHRSPRMMDVYDVSKDEVDATR